MKIKVTVSRCLLEECCQGQLLCKVSSSQLPLLQRNELCFYTRRDVNFVDSTQNFDKVTREMKEKTLGQGVCLKSVSRVIIMQGFILSAITATE